MKVSLETKIASIVKENPLALDAIVSISKSFEKLRNPFLYKLMARRASIQMACKIAGCRFVDFIDKLKPLGFEFDMEMETTPVEKLNSSDYFPDENNLEIIKIDVRPIISSGSDPLQEILTKVNELNNNQLLEVTNSFLPMPLIMLLEKKGFKFKIVTQDPELSIVLFSRNQSEYELNLEVDEYDSNDWEKYCQEFESKWKIIDVRHLQMPMPMITILEEVENLHIGNALFVKHHKVPLFLLPELAERNIEYRIKRINEKEVHLILFQQQ